MTDKTAEQTAFRKALLKNGYTPLANVSKKCMLKNWPRLEVTEAMIDDWADRRGLLATGVRIEGALVALDFDIDDATALDTIWNALPDDLFNLIDAMPVRHGSGNKMCLFCRVQGARGIEHIWSKAFYRPGESDAEKASTHRLEVFGSLSGGRQVGVYGAHTVENGEIRVMYTWADNRGLVEIPLDELPELTVAQLERLADTVSETLSRLGWEYEVRSLDGRVAASRAYVLTGDEMFHVYGCDAAPVPLDALEDMARNAEGVRVSMGWREGPGAVNRTRGLVSINPADDRIQIWDTMTGVLYRPLETDWSKKGRELGDKLRARGLVQDSGEQARSSVLFPIGGSEDGAPSRCVVRVDAGRLAEAVRAVVGEMRGFPDVFDMGRPVKIVPTADGPSVVNLDDARLAQEIGERFLCVREVEHGRRVALENVDPPSGLIKQTLALFRESGFRPLRGVVDMPVPDNRGEIITDGYDTHSRLLVSDSSGAAAWLGSEDVRSALETLWTPFEGFPFVGDADRGGALACILTAVARAWLPTAPMFAFDAPVQGSGKSLMCRAVGALSGRCLFSAPLPLKNEDEVRKRIMAMLLAGPTAVIYDNQTGLLDSAVVAAVLTSDTFSDRELGQNVRVLVAPTNVLVMVNGNNLAIGGDLPRRTVRIRIDPQTETPFERHFNLDPETWVRANRGRMLAAALTILRWGMKDATAGRVGSFERWDEVVGQTVARTGREIDNRFGDPADTIRAAHEDDPRRDELGDLLLALRAEFGNKWFTGSDVVARMAGSSTGNPLIDAFGYDKPPNAKAIGRHLTYRRDAKVRGLQVQIGRDARTKINRFRVWSDDDQGDVVVDGELERRRAEHKTRMGSLGRI